MPSRCFRLNTSHILAERVNARVSNKNNAYNMCCVCVYKLCVGLCLTRRLQKIKEEVQLGDGRERELRMPDSNIYDG